MTERFLSHLDLHAKRSLTALGLLTWTAPFLWGQQPSTPAPLTQSAPTPLPALAYDVASIHKFKPDGGPMTMFWRIDPDGFTASHLR